MTAQTPPILRYFAFDHLPNYLKAVSAPFAELANHLVEALPPGPELSVALRKLLESKDAAVRAALDLPKES
ncbi:hypothetical protein ACN6K6_000606 [Streptomyces violaceoruber]|uniref:hypothetical protein n=1 Tax=Streptomyces TaxID=1883 RepID=UPI0029ADD5CD|nr:hypothetical protein [Streptomyces sp. ME02-6977A]MDX3405517.1 hypothetical protein [Streptomyces sp. ME02-6977A]